MTMRPKAIFVEKPDTDNVPRYRVLFEGDDGKEVEHLFTINSDGEIHGVRYGNDYYQVMPPEPFTKWLCESIIRLHQAIEVVS
jgi:hypothetical protein